MTSLVVTTIELPSAPLGPSSPLPMIDPLEPIERIGSDVPTDIAGRARSGTPPTLLPYLAQDDYSRRLEPRAHRVAVLENDVLRAVVALDLGGRVLSLHDLRTDRQLLYVNPVVQPANLALRNAWISGGIEWNIGTRGHSPTTMDTLHAARLDGPDGEPMLRLWEFERLRGAVFQVDLWLPSSHAVLLARTRIRNLNDEQVPMYWWTNAAIHVEASTRVVAPAQRAFRTEYPNGVRVVTVPDHPDGDPTAPSRNTTAADYFYDIAPSQRPWIAAVDDTGRGLAHVSTSALRGRKLFVWGTGSGGRRWQQWLSHGGDEEYAEIQAGLAPTQFEHLPMPGRAEWAWTEAFGAIVVDRTLGHGTSWGNAVEHVGGAVDELVPPERLDELHEAAGAVADRPPQERVSTGSGWGALERLRREALGTPWFDDAGTPFCDDSLGAEQEPWLTLLRGGTLPDELPERPPTSYIAGGDWETRLAAAPPTWWTDYHGAVIAHGRGDHDRAADLYGSSMRRRASAWAARGLAEVAGVAGRRADAVRHAVTAWKLAPQEWRLAAEAIDRLLDDDRPHEALAVLEELPDAVRTRGRLRLLEGWAAIGAGDAERARSILAGLEVADVREGERSIDRLWNAVHGGAEVPAELDFRMH